MWLQRRLPSELNTPPVGFKRQLSVCEVWLRVTPHWLDFDVKRWSHIPHLTENTGWESPCLPSGLVPKCYFHCSDASLFLYFCQSSFKLFSSSKLWPTSFYHLLLFSHNNFPCRISKVCLTACLSIYSLPSSLSFFSTRISLLSSLVAYTCFPSL